VTIFKQIKQYNNILSAEEFQHAQEYFNRPMWTLMNADPQSEQLRAYWRMSLMQDRFFMEDIFDVVCKATKSKFEIIDVYANGSTTSQSSSAHVDAHEPDIYIFMMYMNPEWFMQWGGQTIFCNKYWDTKTNQWNDGTSDTVSYFPKPNSALYFPANIIHLAEAPSRDFLGLRTTVAYRLKKL